MNISFRIVVGITPDGLGSVTQCWHPSPVRSYLHPYLGACTRPPNHKVPNQARCPLRA